MSHQANQSFAHSGIKVNTLPPKEFLDECFEYNPETGELKWKARPLGHFGKVAKMNRWNALYAGKSAGFKWKDGRKQISLCYEGVHGSFLNTRIIFALMQVEVPDGMVIDHINRERGDDRWENLRVVWQGQNVYNSISRKRWVNPEMPRGVQKNGKGWCAIIQHHKKRIYLGTYSSPEEAHAVWKAKALELRGEFAVTQ